MHDYATWAGGVGAQAVPVAPGLLGVNAPVMTSHAVIGGSSMAASASASALAFMPLSDSGSTTHMTCELRERVRGIMYI